VVLGINKTVEYYHGNPKAEGLQRIAHPEPADLELEKDAMALYQMADELYTSRRYAVRETAPGKLNAAK
jgi:hypothetical protein